jgi:hypothetical protein
MNTFIAYLAIALISVSLISVFYWRMLHVVLLNSLRYRLFARRDELRMFAIEGKVNPDSFAYEELEAIICKILALMPSTSLLSFLFFRASPRQNDVDSRMGRFMEEASPELRRMMQKSISDSMKMMALNSPILSSGFLAFALIAWIFGRFSKGRVIEEAECFVDDLPRPSQMQPV